MELIASIKGLEALNNPSNVHVFSDSQYLVQGMSKWLRGWSRNGRLDEPGALANQDLWKQLEALSNKHAVTWEWVRGHAGHPFNERCDKLAKRALAEGLQALDTAQQSTEALTEAASVPVTAAETIPEPVPIREDSEFDTEDDGQLRLC